MKLIFASHNANKTAEIRALLPQGIELLSLTDIGCHDEIPETAATLEGNAELKARYVWEHYGLPCFADDTGLEVEALNGAPGVYSARYAGSEKSAEANMALLLQQMQAKENRQARFRTVIAYIDENGTRLFDGIVNGQLTKSGRGTQGFGYDPIFEPEGLDRTFAEMSMDEKGKMSHRARALQAFLSFLSDTE